MQEYVVKAQIAAGGRKKGVFSNGFEGGVHLTKDSFKMEHLASKMLGNYLITNQTPPEGILVNSVYLFYKMCVYFCYLLCTFLMLFLA